MIEVTVNSEPRLIAKQEIVYIFAASSGSEIHLVSTPAKFLEVGESISTLLTNTGFVELTVGGVTYAVNPAHVREVRKNINDTKCTVETTRRELEPDEAYSVVSSRFIAFSPGGGDGTVSTDGTVIIGDGDATDITLGDQGADNGAQVLAWSTADSAWKPKRLTADEGVNINAGADAITISGYQRQSSNSGSFTAETDYLGEPNSVALGSVSQGVYGIVPFEGNVILGITVFADNSDLTGADALELRIDNGDNSRDRRFAVQVYDAATGVLTAKTVTQTVAANVTTIVLEGMDTFGATGFYVELR